MDKLLFVNACIRGERSRTYQLAAEFFRVYRETHPDTAVEEFDVCATRLPPQYPEVLEERDRLWNSGRLDDAMFGPAHQFAQADRIVIAAPFWDLAFPAALKIYLERISVTDITFGYTDDGRLKGLCRAEKMLFITTRGGNFSLPETEHLEMGARYLRALCEMYGIPQFELLCAEPTDDVTVDVGEVMAEAKERAARMAPGF